MKSEKSNVQTRTRLNQVGMISPLLLPGIVAVLEATLPSSFSFTFKVATGAIIVLALFIAALTKPSRSETARVEDERIIFKERKPIEYKEIEKINFDDYIKIKIRGEFWYLLLQCTNQNRSDYNVFLDEFRSAFSEWQRTDSNSNISMPQQTFFYGSWKSTLAGCGLITAYACLVAASIRIGAAFGYIVIGGLLIIPISLRLIFSRRRK